jgi:undecaprenyl-diphosphatase
MSVIEAIILGIIQGFTEFVPISSSAHIIIVPWLLGWDEPGLTFNVAVHLGTLLAVLVYFWRDLTGMALALPRGIIAGRPLDDPQSRLALIIIAGSFPAGIIGLTLDDRIEGFFHAGGQRTLVFVIIATMLIVMGVLMLLAERLLRQHRVVDQLGWRDGILIGVAQAIALIPGASRSGSTITMGLLLGLRREAAARFSFLLGAPIVAAAGLLETARLLQTGLPAGERLTFISGIVVAAIIGYTSIAFLLRFLQSNSVLVFTVYRVGLATVILAVIIARGA